jgi:PhnB protein
MLLTPYLFFDGRCEEALEFYGKTIGAQVISLMRFKESPEPQGANGDKVMHASMRLGESMIMLSDGHCGGKAHFEGFSLSLTVPDEATAKRSFDGLADGGEIVMPLGKTFFAAHFGMVKDRFGVQWMVMVPA